MDSIKLLKKLVDKLKKERPNLNTLKKSGILNKNNEFTSHYKNLNKIFKK